MRPRRGPRRGARAAAAFVVCVLAHSAEAAEGAPEPPSPEEAVSETPAADAAPLALRPPTPQLHMRLDFYGGWAPKAVLLRYTLNYRYTYLRDSEPGIAAKLLDRTYIEGGLSVDLTAPFGRYGLFVEWLPLQVLRIRLDGGLLGYHGAVGLLEYSSTNVDWSERARYRRQDERPALLGAFRATTELRLKIWRFVAVSLFEANYHAAAIDAPFLFEHFYGLLAAREDWILCDRSLLLFELIAEADQTFRIGAYHSVQHAVGTAITNQRAGIAMVWEPTRSWWILDRPQILLLAGLHLEDRYFQGRPTLIMGLSTSIDVIEQE